MQTKLILQDNLYETHDTSIIDVCYGLGALINLGNSNKHDQNIKLGRIKEIKQI